MYFCLLLLLALLIHLSSYVHFINSRITNFRKRICICVSSTHTSTTIDTTTILPVHSDIHKFIVIYLRVVPLEIHVFSCKYVKVLGSRCVNPSYGTLLTHCIPNSFIDLEDIKNKTGPRWNLNLQCEEGRNVKMDEM